MMLFPYQEVGVQWLIERERTGAPHGGFLCDEMGMGKTIQLAELFQRNHVESTLVVVPKSIVGQWRSELKRFAPRLSVHVFDGPKRVWAKADVTIVPYSLVEQIPEQEWGRIVLDEGHEIRNPKSKGYRMLKAMTANVRWVVTGTPIFNSMKDFVALCEFIGISKGSVMRDFITIRQEYVLRRTREDAETQLDFQNVELDMYPEERVLYEDAFMRGHEIVTKHSMNVNSMVVLECLLRIRQVMIWPQLYLDGMATKNDEDTSLYTGRSKKHETFFDMITSHPDEKSLVFTQFTGEADHLQEVLVNKGFPVFRLDGSVDNHEREKRIADFQTAPANAIFLIQIKAGGVGLNLQCASRVYIMGPSWNPATELQAIGRSHRTGQTRKVIVRKFVYKDPNEEIPSVEQNIVDLQMSKSRVCAEILRDEKINRQIPGMSQMKIRTIIKIFKIRT
jgi:SNF2 family DNA or RNA helicase